MKPAVTILAALSLCVWCLAQTPPIVPDDVLARIQEEHPNPLPRYMTPDERDLPLPLPSRDAPPSGVIHCPAEYEPCQGLFISWQGYTTILTQLAVGVTVNDPTATVYVVVDSSSEQTSAYNTLSTAGAHMDQIQFIVRITDTVWIRDYGPRFIFDDGARAIIDHTYNRPRPNDDAFNDYLATLWNEPQYDIGLTHGGGNFHLFTNGDAFMSSLILAENPGLTEQQIKDRYRDYQNVSLTIYTGFPNFLDLQPLPGCFLKRKCAKL